MKYIEQIRKTNPALAASIEAQVGCLTNEQLVEVAKIDRFIPVLVRCGQGRFTVAAEQANHFINIINDSKAEYVRDVSLLA